jgi:hypothetical protein
MNNSRYESKYSKKNIKPEMGFYTNGQKYTKRRENDGENDSENAHSGQDWLSGMLATI